MSFQLQASKKLFMIVLLMSAFILSSCAAKMNAAEADEPEAIVIPDADEIVQPEINEEDTEGEALEIISHEGARDIAVAYLMEKFALEAPGEWSTQDQIPEGWLGTSDFLFTSGAWVVRTKAPVVAPEYLVYSIVVDHVASGTHWEGEVDAWGNLKESLISESLTVLSPEGARDAAQAFIVAEYGWDPADEWIEQSVEPIENAGVLHTFTSGPWVLQVRYYAAAPIVPDYHVVADHLSLVARWEGRVSADGEIVEEA